MEDKKVFKKVNIYIVFCILFVCMIIGSFYDYQISCSLYNEQNMFGRIFAAYGQLPMSLAYSISGTLLIFVCKKKLKFSTIMAFTFGIVLNVFALLMGVVEPMMYFKEVPQIWLIGIAFSILILVNIGVLYLIKDSSTYEIKRFIKFTMFVIVMQLILINLIKVPWARPRMRLIANNSDALFQPWWTIGSNLKDSLIASGVASEEFKSFPSGHMASAACLLIICVFPYLNDKYKGKGNILFWSACGFASVVGLSRLIMGAHFLSDITIGFTLTLGIVLVGYYLFYGKISK